MAEAFQAEQDALQLEQQYLEEQQAYEIKQNHYWMVEDAKNAEGKMDQIVADALKKLDEFQQEHISPEMHWDPEHPDRNIPENPRQLQGSNLQYGSAVEKVEPNYSLSSVVGTAATMGFAVPVSVGIAVWSGTSHMKKGSKLLIMFVLFAVFCLAVGFGVNGLMAENQNMVFQDLTKYVMMGLFGTMALCLVGDVYFSYGRVGMNDEVDSEDPNAISKLKYQSKKHGAAYDAAQDEALLNANRYEQAEPERKYWRELIIAQRHNMDKDDLDECRKERTRYENRCDRAKRNQNKCEATMNKHKKKQNRLERRIKNLMKKNQARTVKNTDGQSSTQIVNVAPEGFESSSSELPSSESTNDGNHRPAQTDRTFFFCSHRGWNQEKG
jgi:hypothetical protein